MPESYVIAFSTDPSSGPRDIQGGTGFQFRHGDSWIPSSTSLDHVPSFQLDSEEALRLYVIIFMVL
ncbi:Hypothetical protein FKW44_024031 [Caligus rogercresseyi]|uniref:Uncharacterized protein n=1 Tax=Caligus rogercresseyi TaxID=217165 RepID=A0A7T8GPX7_CALRO|nr:Hypothetical protein FKW44_024031 [Caligus rogercresseyi]